MFKFTIGSKVEYIDGSANNGIVVERPKDHPKDNIDERFVTWVLWPRWNFPVRSTTSEIKLSNYFQGAIIEMETPEGLYCKAEDIHSWKPIKEAPKDGSYILIREKEGYVPDLVRWKHKRILKVDMEIGITIIDIPEGWFTRSDSRSVILNPKEYFLIHF